MVASEYMTMTCPECGRAVSKNKDGSPRSHKDEEGDYCRGRTPEVRRQQLIHELEKKSHLGEYAQPQPTLNVLARAMIELLNESQQRDTGQKSS